MEYIRESRRPPGRLKAGVWGAPPGKKVFCLGLLTEAEEQNVSLAPDQLAPVLPEVADGNVGDAGDQEANRKPRAHPTGKNQIYTLYVYINDYIGVGDSGTLLLLHRTPRLIYMAIYGSIWLYMLIYTLKYVFGAFGEVFGVSELIFWCLNLYF